MELFKFASTLFLGIGVAAVLQGRLVEAKDEFAITERLDGGGERSTSR